MLYFIAQDSTSGRELWAIGDDGNAFLVKDFNPGASDGSIGGMTTVDGVMYVTAMNGADNLRHLYTVEDTTVTEVTGISGVTVGDVFSLGGTAYAVTTATGTAATTLNRIEDGAAVSLGSLNKGNTLTSVNNITSYLGDVFFTATVSGKPQVFRKIGSADPVQVTFSSDSTFQAAPSAGFVSIAGQLYFAGITTTGGNELYRVNTSGQIELATDLWSGSGGSSPKLQSSQSVTFNGERYFIATVQAGDGTAIHKITADGTVVRVSSEVMGASLGSGVEFDGSFYFNGSVNGNSELWRITSGGSIEQVAEIIPGTGSNQGSTPGGLTVFNGALYFVADHPTEGREMFRLDAGSSSPVLATNLSTHYQGGQPRNLTVFEGALYFVAFTNNWITDLEIYRYSGGVATKITTSFPDDVNTFPTQALSAVSMFVSGNYLYFVGQTTANGAEIWRIDSNGNASMVETRPGADSGVNNKPAFFNHTLPPGNAPTDIDLAGTTVREFPINGTVVGTLSTTDPDITDTHTYTLTNSAGGRFKIVGNQIQVANGLLIDFEQAASHVVTVQTRDPTGRKFTESFTITITNVTPEVVNGDGAANTFVGGAGNDTLRGFGGIDTLTGGIGNDTLDGGTQADRMNGGAGNDTYFVDIATDTVNEGGGSGVDTVNSSVTLSLVNSARMLGVVENLTLTGNALNATGNAVANVLKGNALGNIITGGLGNDQLTGGGGRDFFVFNTAPNAATNRDTIMDFSAPLDTIRLENAVFAKLGAAGALNPAFFKLSTQAKDANDYIQYNKATGALIYDSNGSAAGGAVQFATLATKPTITAADFVVI